MNFQLLKKKGGSRFKEFQTIKVCKNNKLRGKQTLKDARESGMDTNNFVHVIKSVLDTYDKPVVVKIMDAENLFVDQEIRAIKHLQNFEYSVPMICHFTCMDDKKRWNRSYENQSLEFCSNQTDKLHFIVYEYIDGGDVSEYFASASQKEAACMLFQISIALMIMGFTYSMTHGDLNSGNILLRKTDKTKILYKISGTSFFIQTYGYEPVFIDFPRSKILKLTEEFIMEDVFTAFKVSINYSPSRKLFQLFLKKQMQTNYNSPQNFIKDMKDLIQNLPSS